MWNGNNFYKWKRATGLWEPSDDSKVNAMNYVKCSNIGCQLTPFDLNYDHFTDGVRMITDFCQSFMDALNDHTSTPEYIDTVKCIKETPIIFNSKAHLIPFHSGVLQTKKSKVRIFRIQDVFSVKLDYDIGDETTELGKNYVKRLKCDTTKLANTIIRCGVIADKFMTIVCGPKKSGKSSLVQIIRKLYGPFVCEQSEYNESDKNIRSCIIDNNELPTTEFVDNHQCEHLIVTCESTNIKHRFGDRKVIVLKLSEPITPNKVVDNIVVKMTTKLQMASLLYWTCTQYDDKRFLAITKSDLMKEFPENFPEESDDSSAINQLDELERKLKFLLMLRALSED